MRRLSVEGQNYGALRVARAYLHDTRMRLDARFQRLKTNPGVCGTTVGLDRQRCLLGGGPVARTVSAPLTGTPTCPTAGQQRLLPFHLLELGLHQHLRAGLQRMSDRSKNASLQPCRTSRPAGFLTSRGAAVASPQERGEIIYMHSACRCFNCGFRTYKNTGGGGAPRAQRPAHGNQHLGGDFAPAAFGWGSALQQSYNPRLANWATNDLPVTLRTEPTRSSSPPRRTAKLSWVLP